MCVCICRHIHREKGVNVCMYVYMYRERERERERQGAGGSPKRCRNPHAPTQVDGNHSALAELAAGGADVNWRHPSWRLASPLHKAAQLGHAQVVDVGVGVGAWVWVGGREGGWWGLSGRTRRRDRWDGLRASQP